MGAIVEEKEVVKLSNKEYFYKLSEIGVAGKVLKFINEHGLRLTDEQMRVSNIVFNAMHQVIGDSKLPVNTGDIGYLMNIKSNTPSEYNVSIIKKTDSQRDLSESIIFSSMTDMMCSSVRALRDINVRALQEKGHYYFATLPIVLEAIKKVPRFTEYIRTLILSNPMLKFDISYNTGNCGIVFVKNFYATSRDNIKGSKEALSSLLDKRVKGNNYSILMGTDRENGSAELAMGLYAEHVGQELIKSGGVRNRNSNNIINVLTLSLV
jgi:hypothetical protein